MVKVKWWEIKLKFSGKETEGLLWALATGLGASWIVSELGAPTVISGLSFGLFAAALTTVAVAIGFINWENGGKGFTLKRLWNGLMIIW